MFTDFEKEFMKINHMKTFDYLFWGAYFLATFIIILFIIFYKINFIVFIIIYVSCFLISSLIFLYKFHKKYPKKSIKNIIKLNSFQISKTEKKEFYDLLKKYHINTKEHIKFLIEHYELKEIAYKPKSFFNKVIEQMIIIIPILAIFFDENKIYIIVIAVFIGLIYGAFYIINTFLFKTIFLGYDTIKSESIYAILIDNLAYIYFHYDKHQKYLK